MHTLVIGAHGRTGQRIVRLLRDGPHSVIAMVRDPAQRAVFDALAVPTVLGDLEYPIDHAVRSVDAIIFAAGSGGHTGKDKTVLVDHIGAIRSMVTAQVEGARRFVMLSALNVDVASQSRISHYHRAKAHADNHLCETDLDWTVVRPGALIDDPGAGRVAVSAELHGDGRTRRDDLAAALVGCLDAPNTIRKSFSLVDGDVPMEQALRSV